VVGLLVGEVGVVGVVDPSFQGGGVPVVDQLQVVDPGRRGGLVGVGAVGSGGGMDVPADPVWHGGADVSALVAHQQVGQVEDQVDAAADQGGVDGVDVACAATRSPSW
jgi:hypothetical protein